MGDPFMFGNKHESLSRQGVARLFGKDFAEQIFSLQAGQWYGPLESGYGLHLVHIDSLSEVSRPALVDIRDKVQQEWSAEQRRQLDEAFYKQLRSRYEVIVEATGERNGNKTVSQN